MPSTEVIHMHCNCTHCGQFDVAVGFDSFVVLWISFYHSFRTDNQFTTRLPSLLETTNYLSYRLQLFFTFFLPNVNENTPCHLGLPLHRRSSATREIVQVGGHYAI